jgi:hypothetical protein
MLGSPTFSCDVEMYIYLLRHEGDPLIDAWWIGWEFAQKGRTLERALWKVRYGI